MLNKLPLILLLGVSSALAHHTEPKEQPKYPDSITITCMEDKVEDGLNYNRNMTPGTYWSDEPPSVKLYQYGLCWSA